MCAVVQFTHATSTWLYTASPSSMHMPAAASKGATPSSGPQRQKSDKTAQYLYREGFLQTELQTRRGGPKNACAPFLACLPRCPSPQESTAVEKQTDVVVEGSSQTEDRLVSWSENERVTFAFLNAASCQESQTVHLLPIPRCHGVVGG